MGVGSSDQGAGVLGDSVLVTRVEEVGTPTGLQAVVNWARRWSLFQYPFVTACCGMEYMSWMCSHYDPARFGAEAPRFSPRQSDVMFVVGTISHKQAPVLRRVYDQMCEPKWVIAFGACASSGGFYDNYATVQGIDCIVPVDVYIPGCPPRPEAVFDALMLLQSKIDREPRGRWVKRPDETGDDEDGAR